MTNKHVGILTKQTFLTTTVFTSSNNVEAQNFDSLPNIHNSLSMIDISEAEVYLKICYNSRKIHKIIPIFKSGNQNSIKCYPPTVSLY